MRIHSFLVPGSYKLYEEIVDMYCLVLLTFFVLKIKFLKNKVNNIVIYENHPL